MLLKAAVLTFHANAYRQSTVTDLVPFRPGTRHRGAGLTRPYTGILKVPGENHAIYRAEFWRGVSLPPPSTRHFLSMRPSPGPKLHWVQSEMARRLTNEKFSRRLLEMTYLVWPGFFFFFFSTLARLFLWSGPAPPSLEVPLPPPPPSLSRPRRRRERGREESRHLRHHCVISTILDTGNLIKFVGASWNGLIICIPLGEGG